MSFTSKLTKSRCTVCQVECPAEVFRDGDDILMDRTCPTHGKQRYKIAHARYYWHAQGNPSNACSTSGTCCSSAGENRGTLGTNAKHPKNSIEELASCTLLIDIVDSCNLACPTCYATSPVGTGENLKYVPFDEIVKRVQGVIDRKGKIELLQLSGGEPTLHPDFFKILLWAFDHQHIDHVLVNTNGVRIATDDGFVENFKKIFRPKKMRLYLQYDGPQEIGQTALRGADLRSMRTRCIERCGEIGLTLHLAMTVNPDNLPYVWEALVFGAKYPQVLGISYQPMFLSGRSGGSIMDQPITSGDIIIGLIDQSNQYMMDDDFTPLPCGDPNCQIVSGLIRIEGKLIPVVRFLDRANINKVLHDKIHFDVEALKKCGCENQLLTESLKEHVLLPENGFFIFIKPFMDARTWDKDRIDRCCTHVVRPDGELDSFCRYYSGFPDTLPKARKGFSLSVVS